MILPQHYEILSNNELLILARFDSYHPEPYVIWKCTNDVLYDGIYFTNPKDALEQYERIICELDYKEGNFVEESTEHVLEIQGDSFPERLRFLRKAKNLTQAELSEQIGISYGAIANYELGFRKPNYKSIILLEEYFGVSGSDLMPVNTDAKEFIHLSEEETISEEGNSFSKILKNLRKEKSLTQEKLALTLGIPVRTLINWEVGTRKPNAKYMAILEGFFDIKGSDLIPNKRESEKDLILMSENQIKTMNFSDKLKHFRKKRGLKQGDLAHVVNLSINTIRSYENSRRKPTGEILLKLAKALDVTAELLG